MNHMNFNTNLCKREYYKYFNLRKKYHINNANIHYNLKCRENNIIPTYAKCKHCCKYFNL